MNFEPQSDQKLRRKIRESFLKTPDLTGVKLEIGASSKFRGSRVILSFQIKEQHFYPKKDKKLFKCLQDRIQKEILKAFEVFKASPTRLPDLTVTHSSEVPYLNANNFLNISEYYLKIPDCPWPYPLFFPQEISWEIQSTLKSRLQLKYRALVDLVVTQPDALVSIAQSELVEVLNEQISIKIWCVLGLGPRLEWTKFRKAALQRFIEIKKQELETFLLNPKLRGSISQDSFTIENSTWKFVRSDWTKIDNESYQDLFDKTLERIKERALYDNLLSKQIALISNFTKKWTKLSGCEIEMEHQPCFIQQEYRKLVDFLDCSSQVFLRVTDTTRFKDLSPDVVFEAGQLIKQADLGLNPVLNHQTVKTVKTVNAKNKNKYVLEYILQILTLSSWSLNEKVDRIVLLHKLIWSNQEDLIWEDETQKKYLFKDLVFLPQDHSCIKTIKVFLCFLG